MGQKLAPPPFRYRIAGIAVFLAALASSDGARAFDLGPSGAKTATRVAQSNLPPASIPGDSVDSGDPGELVVRLDRLEADLRRANGEIEELQNQNRRLEDQLRRFREDVEFRLGGGTGPGPSSAPVASMQDAPPPRPRKGDAFDPAADPTALGAPRPLGSTAPSAPLNGPLSARSSAAGPPLDLNHPAPAAPPKGPDTGPTIVTSGLDFTDAPHAQFSVALDAYKAGQYAAAEEQLKAFLAANAAHRLAPDAIFYLGETYMQRSRPREAAEQYLKLSTDYSKSARAPEGLMRLGQSLAMLGNAEQACATFAEVGKRYPTASTQIKKTVEKEMQTHHCGA
jgi:tol-pal system protein YbgF